MLAAFAILFLSIVPHFQLTESTAVSTSILPKAYQGLHNLFVVIQYGQHLNKIRPKRLEIILEYADDITGPWHEYGFQYKPWIQEGSMPYAWVYFPRFDFKFYDASNSKPYNHKWLYPLVQRLLQNEPAMVKLLDEDHVPSKPPKYIRASLYHFSYNDHFSWFEGNSTTFWTRERLNDYFPAYALQDGFLETKIKDIGIPPIATPPEATNLTLKWLVDAIRNFLGIFEGSLLVSGVLTAAVVMIITQKHT
ncbi:AAEL013056-PA [Aedes aegypti]|uniref:Lipase maturation factor 2 n=2 Tax=Aedes aegypti TaxID=7159 RepID=A0A1S4FY12_AEDAE|nr:lipase maturation factor 2 [Aedes aegypti]EAT34737.1 AAEL013056-PA [Aedes aegypti]